MNTTTTRTLAEAYALACTLESPPKTTRKRYESSLRRLAESGIKSPEDVTREAVAAHLERRRAAKITPAGVNNDLDALLAALRYLVRRGEFDKARIASLKELRLKRPPGKSPTYLTLEQATTLFAMAERSGRGAWFRLALEVAFYTGVRRTELRTLRVEDFDLDARVLRVRAENTKTKRPRVVPLCAELLAILRERAPKSGAMFPPKLFTARQDFVSEETFKRSMMELSRWSPLGVKLGWHIFRRSFITRALQGGAPLPEVARWVGHTDVSMIFHHYYSFAVGYTPAIEALSAGPKAAPPALAAAPVVGGASLAPVAPAYRRPGMPSRERFGCLAGRPLTARQREIAGLVAKGLTDGEIMTALGLARCTIRQHIEEIFAKLGVLNRTEVAAKLAKGVTS